MKNILICFVLIVLISCSTKWTSDLKVCQELGKLYKQDQKYRGSKTLEDPFFRILDSIRISEGLSKNEYKKLKRQEQLNYGKKARIIANKIQKTSRAVQDSLMNLQLELDYINTKVLLEIIHRRGFPDINKLNCNVYSTPMLIFVHSPEKYWKKIREVIDIEKKVGRITEGDYQYILWHINGRKGVPAIQKLED